MKFLKKEYLLSALMLVFGVTMISSQATAQTTEAEVEAKVEAEVAVELAGIVIDKASQEAIAGAKVKIGDETATTTGAEGEFSIESLKPGLHKVTVKAEGYEKWTKEVTLAKEGKKLEVKLVASEG